LQALTSRLADVTLELLVFLLDMWRGMEEFRRANQIPAADLEMSSLTLDRLAARLLEGDTEALESLSRWVQELKVHHAALLEGYQEATGHGSRRILDELDPAALSREFEGARLKVGPVRLPARWRPVLVQAIWEEYLRRFQKLRSLEASEYERFHREGFRQGYRRFLQRGRRREPSAGAESGQS
jgi:hypothetical protein